jgi:hypothetical protein
LIKAALSIIIFNYYMLLWLKCVDINQRRQRAREFSNGNVKNARCVHVKEKRMKKVLAALVITLILSAPVHAFPMIYAGAQNLQFGFESRDGDWHLEFGYGNFVTDELLLGTFFSFTHNAIRTRSVGGTMEYHFHLGTMTFPYIAGIIMYEDYDTDQHFRYGPAVGVNHFIARYFSIDLRARYLFSSRTGREENLEILGGLRILF